MRLLKKSITEIQKALDFWENDRRPLTADRLVCLLVDCCLLAAVENSPFHQGSNLGYNIPIIES